jgi:hypothetical protein
MEKKMKKLSHRKLSYICILLAFFISGCENMPIEKFVTQRVVLASGIDFNNQNLVLLDSETGEEISCNPFAETNLNMARLKNKENYLINEKPNCENQFSFSNNSDSNALLKSALELAKECKQIEIIKDGKSTLVSMCNTVTILYPGSICNTTVGPGTTGQSCSPKKKKGG